MTESATASPSPSPRLSRAGIAIAFIASIMVALVVAVIALVALHAMTQQHRETRHDGVLLADLERLRFNLEERIATARGYLVTRDDAALIEIGEQREKFTRRLRTLATGYPELAPRLEAIAAAELALHEEILATNQLRASTQADFGAVFESVRVRLREKRQVIEASLESLSREHRAKIDEALDRNERLEARVRLLFMVSVIILALAAAFGMAITRRLRRALHSESEARALAEALASEVYEQSKQVELRLREASAELDALRAPRS